MASDKVAIGKVEMVSLTDSKAPRDPLQAFPETTLEQWRTHFPDLLDRDGKYQSRYGSAAIRSGGKLIVVDTGLQNPESRLLEDMRKKGIDREAVELVVMTHLHPDHVGWNLTDGRPTFPKARYLVPKADWDYYTKPSVLEKSPHVRDQVMPLEKLRIMDLIQGEHRITDEVTAVPTPGHTPGHISIAIYSQGQRGFITGDMISSPAQAHFTDWCPTYDLDKAEARKTRHQALDRLEAERSLVYAGHFPDSGFGLFVRKEGRRVWQGV